MREKALVNRILAELEATPACKAVKIPGGPHMETGTPDILGSYRGQAFTIEAKTEGNTTSRIQEHRLEEWKKAGAVCVRAREDFDVTLFLEGLHEPE